MYFIYICISAIKNTTAFINNILESKSNYFWIKGYGFLSERNLYE